MKLGTANFCAAAIAASALFSQAAPAKADPRIIVEHQGVERVATLYRPSARPGGPLPVIVALHGLGQSVESLHEWLRLDAAAEHAGFAVVYPEAIGRKWNYGRPIKDPQPTVNGKTVDDIGFIRALLDGLIKMKVADPARIYVTGMSRGGLMTYTLTCALSGRIAAAAPLISGMTDHQREDCRPKRPVPMMVVAGTNDESQWYDGIVTPAGRLLSIPETMEYWRVKNGCTEETASWLPHRDESDPTRVRLFEWARCRDNAQLKLYRVSDGGHQLPSFSLIDEHTTKLFGLRNHDIETADEIAKFVMTASLAKQR
jgi:polyhydroxybutyrate depolymerase